MEKFIIDSVGEGWHKHTKKNHNIKSYLNFFVFLNLKKEKNCSGVEKYIKESIKNYNYEFIPYLNSQASSKTEN